MAAAVLIVDSKLPYNMDPKELNPFNVNQLKACVD